MAGQDQSGEEVGKEDQGAEGSEVEEEEGEQRAVVHCWMQRE